MNSRDDLIKVANYYYVQKMSQQEIADKLMVSRQKVSRMLKLAEEQNIVEIRINDYERSSAKFEDKLKQLLGLEQVYIVDTEDPILISERAIEYVERYVFCGINIGVTFGHTLSQLCKSSIRSEKRSINIIQMVGGFNMSTNNSSKPDVIADCFARIMGGESYCLYIPAIIDNLYLKELIYKEEQFKPMLGMLKKIDIALLTIGSMEDHPNNVLVRDQYLRKSDLEHLRSQGAIGDVCLHFFNRNGEIVDKEFDKRLIGYVEDVKAIKTRIGLSYGIHKVEPIIGACRGKFINHLVTNLSTAREIVFKLENNDN